MLAGKIFYKLRTINLGFAEVIDRCKKIVDKHPLTQN